MVTSFPRMNIPKDSDGRYKTFYDFASEITQYHLCCVLLDSQGHHSLGVRVDYMRTGKGCALGSHLGSLVTTWRADFGVKPRFKSKLCHSTVFLPWVSHCFPPSLSSLSHGMVIIVSNSIYSVRL